MSSRKRPLNNDFNSLFGDPLNMKKIKEKSSEAKKDLKKGKKEKKDKNGSSEPPKRTGSTNIN